MGVIDRPCLSLIDVELVSTTPQPMVTGEVPDILMGNFSSTNDSVVCSTALPDTAKHSLEESSLNALMYIVVVLLFYAFSLVVLMVKYIRRENKEAYLRQCFQEFVAREQFQSAQIRNQIHMQHVIRQTDLQLKHGNGQEPRTRHHSAEVSHMESITEQPSGQLAVLVQETHV